MGYWNRLSKRPGGTAKRGRLTSHHNGDEAAGELKEVLKAQVDQTNAAGGNSGLLDIIRISKFFNRNGDGHSLQTPASAG